MKTCRILSRYRKLSNVACKPTTCSHMNTGYSSKVELNLDRSRKIRRYPFQILGFPGVIRLTHIISCLNEPNFGQCSISSRVGLSRCCSTRVESRVNDKNIQRGLNVKPVVVAKTCQDEECIITEQENVADTNNESLKKGVKIEVADVSEVEVAEEPDIREEAWRLLRNAVVTYCNSPIGTVAANDPNDTLPLNYDQVFIRDFIPSALAFLMKGEGEIVKNFLLNTLLLQFPFPMEPNIRNYSVPSYDGLMEHSSEMVHESGHTCFMWRSNHWCIYRCNFQWVFGNNLFVILTKSREKTVDCYSPVQGLMPASFKVTSVPQEGNTGTFEEDLDADFGESAIGRVAPVDSGLWWIILLRAYGKLTGDYTLQKRPDVQSGIRLILNVCLSDGFDMFPTLLVTDGSCMFDRRIGTHGHPLEIQALFYSALRCSREILAEDEESQNVAKAVNNRLSALSFHIREYYWIDLGKVNEIYRYKTEEYSTDAVNKFNIYPEQIPHWLMDWVPREGGYLVGNLQPAHMDFRFFTLGNLWSVISSLGTPKQNQAIINLIEAKWDDLIGQMPLKICFPAVENEEWRIITGSDPKNTPWSYHNGGSWPTLLWQFTLVCLKMGRTDLAEKAIEVAEKRLQTDRWPEYYDTRYGKFVGKQARLYQTWTIAGLETSKMFLENPEMSSLLYWEEDYELLEICVCAETKSGRKSCSRGTAKSHILVPES